MSKEMIFWLGILFLIAPVFIVGYGSGLYHLFVFMGVTTGGENTNTANEAAALSGFLSMITTFAVGYLLYSYVKIKKEENREIEI